MAAALGLVCYVLNNVTYVEGLGSYIRLSAFASEVKAAPGELTQPRPAGTLPRCDSCGMCREACPTGAIPDDRFLLKAERCITSVNELPGPWPQWIPPGAHGCLIGCMTCQEACPLNAGLLSDVDTGVVFDAEETAAILADGERSSRHWRSVKEKLVSNGLAFLDDVIERKAAALMGT
jgi:epoxyqueuosine reductase